MAAVTSVKIIMSPDRLKAWVRVNARPDPKAVTRAHVMAAMEEFHIACTSAVEARLDDLCRQLLAGGLPQEDFLLAEGKPATEPVDAGFEWTEALRPRTEALATEAGRVNHYDRHRILSAMAGTTLGRIIPGQPGQPGVDIYGNPIHPARKPKEVSLCGNVEMASDGQTVVAVCDGGIVFEHHKLSIASVLEVSGDVDFGTGHIDTPGDVVVHGSVKDLFRVRSSRDITVDGHVDGAVLEAGGSIVIHGGIHGHGKAIIRAAGRVTAKICDSSSIEVGKIFSMQRECFNCRVRADRIFSPAGTIIGGYTWARNDIEVQTLGSPAAVKTLVSAGISVQVMDQTVQMVLQAKEYLDSAKKIRQAIEPLMREMCRLSAKHRERATELMFQADTFEQQARDLDTKRDQMLAQAAPEVEPSVLVGGRIYAGVTIVINGRATTIELGKELRGPVRIMERKIEGVMTLVAIDVISGSVHPLPMARFTAEAEKQATETCEAPEAVVAVG